MNSVRATCSYTLPSLMLSGNLGCVEHNASQVPCTMLCLSSDKESFEADPIFQKFASGRIISWIFVDDLFAVLADAREAILSEAFRSALSVLAKHSPETAFLLIKAGYVLPNNVLPNIISRLEGGYKVVCAPVIFADCSIINRFANFEPHCLVKNLIKDHTSAQSALQTYNGIFGLAEAIESRIDDACAIVLRAARWHPIGLRSANPISAGRESLLDFEIVPEFASEPHLVYRVASSDEVLVLDCRDPVVTQIAEKPEYDDIYKRVASWATPWHLANLQATYTLIADPITVIDNVAVPQHLLDQPGISALRHPIWLQARSLDPVPKSLGNEVRYQSILDTYYRASRLAIERLATTEAVYAGHASHVFKPLLARHFSRAFIAPFLLSAVHPLAICGSNAASSLILHCDLHSFETFSSALANAADALTARGYSFLLMVEAPDSQGGLSKLDRRFAEMWLAAVRTKAAERNFDVLWQTTLVNYFEGHPGFILSLTPAEYSQGTPTGGECVA